MKTLLLSIVSVSLLLASAVSWCGAAPGPAHLEEIAALNVGHWSSDLTFSPDGKILFATVRDSVWLWDVVSRKHIATIESNGDPIGIPARMSLSADGKTAICLHGNRIVFWDVASHKQIATLEPDPGKGGRFTRVISSPDGKMAACLCGKIRGNTTIMLWDFASRKLIGSLEEDPEVYWVAFSPDSKTLSAAVRTTKPGLDAELRIWDVEKKERVRTRETHRLSPLAAFDPINQTVLVDTSVRRGLRDLGSETDFFALVDAFTGDAIRTCEVERKYGMPTCFALNREATMLAATNGGAPVLLWDGKSGKSIASFKHPPSHPPSHDGFYLRFIGDGNLLALLYPGGESDLLLYEVPSGKVLAELKRTDGGAPLAFSPDEQLLATGSGRNIKLWSIPEKWRKGK